jgi:peptide/nickel transport system permease protein
VADYAARRALLSIPVLLVASFLLFAFVRSTFDPTVELHLSRDKAAAQRIRHEQGLDRPIVAQYGSWLGGFVQGDWGESQRTHERVFPMVRRALWNTTQLAAWGVLVAAAIAVAIGVYSAVRQYSVGDYALTGLSFVGLAMPPFWFGLLAIQFFVFYPLDWFNLDEPLVYFVGLHSVGRGGFGDYARHLVLPVLTLTVQIVASWSRYQRSSMLDALHADYVRTARAKGLTRRRIIVRHALRNALIPLVTVVALDVGAVFGGLVVTETIFSISGMGRLLIDSLRAGDAPVLLAWVVLTSTIIIAFNLLADVLYAVLDPRIRQA